MIGWENAGDAYYAVHDGRIVAVLYPKDGYGDDNRWWLAVADRAADARPLGRWAAAVNRHMSERDVIACATGAVEALLGQ